mmetsp:Transcript_46426/g.93078  ORF Transcript_46426/g.93078 Transcript_46426/m.93078 type:complete len:231 (+) Transcript_46426:57-749(+)
MTNVPVLLAPGHVASVSASVWQCGGRSRVHSSHVRSSIATAAHVERLPTGPSPAIAWCSASMGSNHTLVLRSLSWAVAVPAVTVKTAIPGTLGDVHQKAGGRPQPGRTPRCRWCHASFPPPAARRIGALNTSRGRGLAGAAGGTWALCSAAVAATTSTTMRSEHDSCTRPATLCSGTIATPKLFPPSIQRCTRSFKAVEDGKFSKGGDASARERLEETSRLCSSSSSSTT